MGEITDLIFSILGKLGRWMNIKGKRVCFIIWAVCLMYWVIRNACMGLMVQTGSCAFSLCLHIYGWYNWKKEKIGE